jgi:excisionase family DNA binding protein
MNKLTVESPPASPFLTVPELARLLHINEKKVYQLAGDGDIPGTKITGKWIFPRRLIDDWIVENSHGGVLHDRLLLAGSDDRLVHQVCNHAAIEYQQSALISYSPCGTRHGLRMLDAGRIDACFINWGASESTARRHLGLLRGYRNHISWIIVRCLQRKQGLIISPEIAMQKKLATDLITDRSVSWALRQDESGTERLLADACSIHGKRYDELNVATRCNSERSAVAAVSMGVADITCGVESTAREYNLPILPLADVSLDLVMSRQTYFRTLMQKLLLRMRDDQANREARSLGGYKLHEEFEIVTVD